MTGRTHRTRVTHRLLMGLLAAGAGFAVAAQPAFSGERPTDAVPGGVSGMMIYIDPQTGAILKEPAPGTVPLQLTPQLQNALSTSHQGLVETPSSVPGDGVKVDLQGRFQSPLFVTIDAAGKVKMQHLDETPESGDKK
jgi:hypothetical protein